MKATPGAVRRATRVLLLIQGLAVIGIYALGVHVLELDSVIAALALGLACVLLLRLLIIGNNFLLAFLYRSPTPRSHRLRWPGLFRLFFQEYAASMASSSWTMAFHSFDRRIPPHPVGLPVLLIHGYGCNSGYWHSMSRALYDAHIAHWAIDLEPVFNDIDAFVPQVARAVERICKESGQQQIILVAHSMGGLVARAYLRDHGQERVRKLITLGTPHRGTGLANFGVGANSRQMRWRGDHASGQSSDWLRDLEGRETAERRKIIVSLYSHHDNIVSPQESSRLPGAANIEFNGIGHVTLGMSPVIQRAVIDEVLRASASRPG